MKPTDELEAVRRARMLALLPFGVFILFYFGLSFYAKDFSKVPMPMAFLVASASAMLLNYRESLSYKLEVFARGMGDSNIMMMGLIFILAGMFATTAQSMGAVDSAVHIALSCIPEKIILPGIFLLACLLSLAIGTSCGTIAALTPIAIGLVSACQIVPEFILGAVIGGAMFGDNLSMISDTTIAATRTMNVAMSDKFRANLHMVMPAAVLVVLLYGIYGLTRPSFAVDMSFSWGDVLAVIPYLLVLILAVCGWNVIFLLFFGTVLCIAIGMFNGSFDLWQALAICGKGTLGMADTLIVAMLAGGLMKLIRWNGGITWLLDTVSSRVKSVRGCELGIALLTGLINLFTANNTVAIVTAGPIAKELSDHFGCSPKRIAGILDTASCVVQGIIPYGAQSLIALGIAHTYDLKISVLHLLGLLCYPWIMGVSLLVSIFLSGKRKAEDTEI